MVPESPKLLEALLASFRHNFRSCEALADRALARLSPTDWLRTATIRGEVHPMLMAGQRQVAHYAYPVGQIVPPAKPRRNSTGQNLSRPRGLSQQFTSQVRGAQAAANAVA